MGLFFRRTLFGFVRLFVKFSLLFWSLKIRRFNRIIRTHLRLTIESFINRTYHRRGFCFLQKPLRPGVSNLKNTLLQRGNSFVFLCRVLLPSVLVTCSSGFLLPILFDFMLTEIPTDCDFYTCTQRRRLLRMSSTLIVTNYLPSVTTVIGPSLPL